MHVIRSVLTTLSRSPVKSALLLCTVGLTVAVVIIAFSIGWSVDRGVSQQLEDEGLVVMVANARRTTGGKLKRAVPYQFDEHVVSVLLTDVPGVVAATSITYAVPEEFLVFGTFYQVRSVVVSSEAYLRVMGLELIAGSAPAGSRQALISAKLAEIVFGSPLAAIGQPMQAAPPRVVVQGSVNQESVELHRRRMMPLYTVRGVFEDPSELKRRAYGIADMVVSSGFSFDAEVTVYVRDIALRVRGSVFSTVASQVNAALSQKYGDDIAVVVWEGLPSLGGRAALDEVRSTVRRFSLAVKLIGLLIYVTSCAGIFSVMFVEVQGRSRQIAMARAFGASKMVIFGEFLTRSLIISGIGAMIGVGLSAFLSRPLTAMLLPIIGDIVHADVAGTAIVPTALATGVVTAIGAGGLLGVLPVFPAMTAPIADGIRG